MSTTITEQKRRGRPKKVDETTPPTGGVEEQVGGLYLSTSTASPPPPVEETDAEAPAVSTDISATPTEPYVHKTIPASVDHDPYAGIGGPMEARSKRRRGGGFWN